MQGPGAPQFFVGAPGKIQGRIEVSLSFSDLVNVLVFNFLTESKPFFEYFRRRSYGILEIVTLFNSLQIPPTSFLSFF
jgi:hypothetical protein